MQKSTFMSYSSFFNYVRVRIGGIKKRTSIAPKSNRTIFSPDLHLGEVMDTYVDSSARAQEFQLHDNLGNMVDWAWAEYLFDQV
jgi:hypothetical protein